MAQPTNRAEHAIAAAISSIEINASDAGWDGPVRIFALVESAPTAAADPEFAAQLLTDPATLPDGHLTAIEQQELPEAETIESLLARIAWPESVAGVACVLERVLLLNDDGAAISPADALKAPGRHDVRIAAGATRNGESWCVLRLRSSDDPDMRLQGPDVVPGIVEQLAASLRPLPAA